MTTKDQERAALAKIRKIVEGLGESSYVETAFRGAFQLAENNIEDDAAYSCDWYIRHYHAASKDIRELQAERDGFSADVTRLRDKVHEQVEQIGRLSQTQRTDDDESRYRLQTALLEQAGNTVKAQAVEIDAGLAEIRMLKGDLAVERALTETRDAEIIRLKAEIYDLMRDRK